MSMPKHAARRDNNEAEVIALARQLYWSLWKMHEPADWLGLFRGQWHVIEVKNENCEGHADEFTGKQKIFHTDVKNRNGKILIWRTEADVIRDSGAKRCA